MSVFRRRLLLTTGQQKSFFNFVGVSQFNPPIWTNGSQGNLLGMQIIDGGTKALLLSNGGNSTTPTFQLRLRVYSLSSTNGVIEQMTDLSFLGQTGDLRFEISSTLIVPQAGFYYNEDLQKFWIKTSNRIIEYDFDISTYTATLVQYITISTTVNNGGFYFTPDGMTLYTSRQASSDNIHKHNLSSYFDIGSITTTTNYTFSDTNGLIFGSRPYFYSDGRFAIYLSYAVGGGYNANINKKAFSTPYDYPSLITSSGYRQAFSKGQSDTTIGIASQATQPIILSNDLLKMNWSSPAPTTAGGGRIGIGYFDIPANFKGNGDELGGVRNITNGNILSFT